MGGWPRFDSQQGQIFQHPEQLWVPPNLLPNGCWGIKWPGHEADSLPPTSTKVNNGGAVTSLSHTFHGVVLNEVSTGTSLSLPLWSLVII
jgi:hypothetical protein